MDMDTDTDALLTRTLVVSRHCWRLHIGFTSCTLDWTSGSLELMCKTSATYSDTVTLGLYLVELGLLTFFMNHCPQHAYGTTASDTSSHSMSVTTVYAHSHVVAPQKPLACY